MKFTIETLNDNGSGMTYNSKKEFFKEVELMINDCIANGGTYFDIQVDSDASCFYQEEDKSSVSFDAILPIVEEWFGFAFSDDDCENIAQEFAMGMNKGTSKFTILGKVCRQYGISQAEFEGICIDLEELEEEMEKEVNGEI